MQDNISDKLFEEFPPVSTKEWEEQIRKDLKGDDYEKKLVWKTLEGFNIKPYYRAENITELEYMNINPGEFPFVRGHNKTNNDWEIHQDFIIKSPVDSNKKILDAIKRGATSIGLELNKKYIPVKEKFLPVLKDIDLEKIPLHLKGEKDSPKFLEYLLDEISLNNLNKTKITGSCNFDPIGYLSCSGNFYSNEKNDFKILTDIVKKTSENLPKFKTVRINGLNFSNAGSSLIQELAYSIAIGIEYLNRLTTAGINIDIAAKSIYFTFGINSNYFMEIAKLRAAKLLWAYIIKEYKPFDIACADMFIHAETSNWNKTIYDPYVNMLRSTTESMSASLGGINALSVKPFDSCYLEESEFSTRIARNTQIILKEEAHFNKIVDPAAGSYYIENLTDNIAHHAWQLLLEIEEKGGYIEAFKKGIIQSSIKEINSKKLNMIATRQQILLGTNQFPNINENVNNKIIENVDFEKNHSIENKIAEPIQIFRVAKEFEMLRLRTEKHPKCPKVFLLPIGEITMRIARATFSSNFFACAGYEIIENSGFNSVEEGTKAVLNANPDIVVICSSDEEYADVVPQIYKQIKNNAIVVVAGAPACKDELIKIGIKHFIHLKSNVLETLTFFHEMLGIG